MKAIKNISLIKQGIKLLQGPPGTGKTHTLIGIVSALNYYMKKSQKNNRKQILICTPSNYAIDEIILRVMQNGLYTEGGAHYKPKIVRLGVTDKIKNPKVLDVCIKTLVDKEIVRRENVRKQAKGGVGKDKVSNDRFADMSDYQLRERNEELKMKIQNLKGKQGNMAKTDHIRMERDKVMN